MKSTIQKLAILLLFVSLFTTTEIFAQLDIPPPDKDDDMALMGDRNTGGQASLVLNQDGQVVKIVGSTLDLADPNLMEGLRAGIYVLRTKEEELVLRK